MADARAVRRVRFTSGSAAADYVAIGTFQITADTIAFALRENGGQSQYVWQVRGDWRGLRFTIRYPDAADGPDIVETYRRQ